LFGQGFCFAPRTDRDFVGIDRFGKEIIDRVAFSAIKFIYRHRQRSLAIIFADFNPSGVNRQRESEGIVQFNQENSKK